MHQFSASGRAVGARAVAVMLTLVAFGGVQAAVAQGVISGSGNTDGFTAIGSLVLAANGKAKGEFTIIVHRDSVENDIVAAVCQYRHFTDVVINGNVATFRSVGACQSLRSDGTRVAFSSNNAFGIIDNGEPGAGLDLIDVNLVSGSGITIPGSVLVDGNFVVTP